MTPATLDAAQDHAAKTEQAIDAMRRLYGFSRSEAVDFVAQFGDRDDTQPTETEEEKP